MTTQIDLNADVGEGCGNDAELIRLVTSANIACGGHAGDEATIEAAVIAAIKAGVTIGAHPGHADRKSFGRRELPIRSTEVAALITEQVRRLQTIAARHDAQLKYIKLHGGLYHQAARETPIANGVVTAVRQLGGNLALLGLADSELATAASSRGVPFFAEAFADRGYQADGSLLPRSAEGSVLTDEALIIAQTVSIATEQCNITATGQRIPLRADSLCLHGDGANAVASALAVQQALVATGVQLNSFLPPRG